MVGKSKVCWECVFAEKRKNLFPKSLMGATIQDGGTRERRGDSIYVNGLLLVRLIIYILVSYICFLIYADYFHW